MTFQEQYSCPKFIRADYSGPYADFWKGGGGCEFKGFTKGVLILRQKSGV